MGCPHNCGEGHRGPPANFVRTQCQCLLNRLKQNDKRQFSNYLRHFIKNNSLTFIINFIHSYTGFCTEPMNVLSPMCKFNAYIYYLYKYNMILEFDLLRWSNIMIFML